MVGGWEGGRAVFSNGLWFGGSVSSQNLNLSSTQIRVVLTANFCFRYGFRSWMSVPASVTTMMDFHVSKETTRRGMNKKRLGRAKPSRFSERGFVRIASPWPDLIRIRTFHRLFCIPGIYYDISIQLSLISYLLSSPTGKVIFIACPSISSSTWKGNLPKDTGIIYAICEVWVPQ